MNKNGFDALNMVIVTHFLDYYFQKCTGAFNDLFAVPGTLEYIIKPKEQCVECYKGKVHKEASNNLELGCDKN